MASAIIGAIMDVGFHLYEMDGNWECVDLIEAGEAGVANAVMGAGIGAALKWGSKLKLKWFKKKQGKPDFIVDKNGTTVRNSASGARQDLENGGYRRNFVSGGTYFFTVTLLERKRDLLVAEFDSLRHVMRRVKRLYPFEIIAWVVLPDHLHCIWSLPEGDADYPIRWRLIKLLFVKVLPKTERLSRVRKSRNERGIYPRAQVASSLASASSAQAWEHTIRDERDLENHVDYIHLNPLKHEYVKHLSDWPYSIFHRYVTKGILPAD